MKAFKRFYIWGMDTKRDMGVYFAALVFLCGLVAACFGQTSLRLIVLLEMLVVSFAIAVLQSFLLPEGTDYTRGLFFGRTMLWAGVSALAIFAAGWAGGWLAVGGPLPCALLGAFMFVGLFAMLVGERFKQEAETEQLNEALARHQKR